MKKYLALFAILLCLTSIGVRAQSNGTIAFTGRVVDSTQSTAPATVVTESTPQPDGTVTTVYAVRSVSTGDTLASFNSLADAQWFIAQLKPTVASRSP